MSYYYNRFPLQKQTQTEVNYHFLNLIVMFGPRGTAVVLSKTCYKLLHISRFCNFFLLYCQYVGVPWEEAIFAKGHYVSKKFEHHCRNLIYNYLSGESVPVEDPTKPSDDLEPGSQRQYSLNDFELIRVIGRGSYAKVLMVELKKTKRIYAMKVIKKALVTDDEDIDWVQTEKHVFETASNHPFLVGLHSCFQTPSRLVMSNFHISLFFFLVTYILSINSLLLLKNVL